MTALSVLTFRRLACALVAGALALLVAGPAMAARTVDVYMTRGDRLQIVERPLPAGEDPTAFGLRALFIGPNRAERGDDISTSIPDPAAVREVVIRDRVAYVRVTAQFATGGSGVGMNMRLAQVVYTVLTNKRVDAVRIVLGDDPMPDPGVDPAALLDHGSLGKVEVIGPVPVNTRQVQERLVALRYLPAGATNGRLDYRTSQALLAFQGWEGLSRTGAATLETRARLNKARIPVPRVATQSRRMEVTRWKGVLLLIEGGEVRRAVHVSTGAGGRTPRGSFGIYRKERMSWSNPFSVWLPYASYFSGGYAFHQYPDVPGWPASHGCIRVGYPDAPVVYDFARYGTPVSVV